MTDVDQPTCARSLALNSYLIDVAYQTHGPAYPPYSITLPVQNTIVNQPTTQAAPVVYNNLATPIVTTDAPTTTATTKQPQETINWS